MKTSTLLRFMLLMALAMESTGYAAGEGTIPFRLTGRVVGSSQDRVVSNATADIRQARLLPPQALRCLSSSRGVKKFLARGKLTLNKRMTEILAVCTEESGQNVEIYTQEQNGAILRIIGRVKKSKK